MTLARPALRQLAPTVMRGSHIVHGTWGRGQLHHQLTKAPKTDCYLHPISTRGAHHHRQMAGGPQLPHRHPPLAQPLGNFPTSSGAGQHAIAAHSSRTLPGNKAIITWGHSTVDHAAAAPPGQWGAFPRQLQGERPPPPLPQPQTPQQHESPQQVLPQERPHQYQVHPIPPQHLQHQHHQQHPHQKQPVPPQHHDHQHQLNQQRPLRRGLPQGGGMTPVHQQVLSDIRSRRLFIKGEHILLAVSGSAVSSVSMFVCMYACAGVHA